MRAAVTVGPGQIRLEQVPDPQPGPGEAVVRVGSVGLCGTDLHMYLGERADTGFPLRQGHEIGGTVAELPAGYDGPLRVDDTVAVDPSTPCGRCRACGRGAWPSCARFQALGVARPGGLADLVTVPVAQLHGAADLSSAEAALVEPFSIAAMALHRAEVAAGDRLLVAGAGPIGLALTICAVARGVPVMVTDSLPSRLALARELGADRAVDVRSGLLADEVDDWTRGDGVDVAIEASGAQPALADCLASLGRGGRLVVVGVATHDLVVPVPKILFEGIQVVGSRAGRFPDALQAVTSQRGKAGRLISQTFLLEQVDDALSFAAHHADAAIKVLVSC